MHATILLLLFWAVAFVTLGGAVVVLSVFYAAIDVELDLKSWRKELTMAGVASLVEALGLWMVTLFIPLATRPKGLVAMVFPALVVAAIYLVSHLEDWGYFEIFLLLVFQTILGWVVTFLWAGHFEAAFCLLVGAATSLIVVGALVKDSDS